MQLCKQLRFARACLAAVGTTVASTHAGADKSSAQNLIYPKGEADMPRLMSEGQFSTRATTNPLAHSLSAYEVRELIARRAYELYERRGPEPGDPLSDWLKAEGEVVSLLLSDSNEIGGAFGPRPTRTQSTARVSKATNGSSPQTRRGSKRKSR
jgi:hypothetical protein